MVEGVTLKGVSLIQLFVKLRAHTGDCPQPELQIAGAPGHAFTSQELGRFFKDLTGTLVVQ